jgi:hypothetical protein
MDNFDFDSTVAALAAMVMALSDRCKAAVFGACGEATLVLLAEVEERSSRRWTFPGARPALDVVADFVTGGAKLAESAHLTDLLFQSLPNGHELDAPWSTYAQDAVACIHAGLIVASASSEERFRPEAIQYALEPLVASLAVRGYDVDIEPLPRGGSPLQRELDGAVDFLYDALTNLADRESLSLSMYKSLIRQANVLIPVAS